MSGQLSAEKPHLPLAARLRWAAAFWLVFIGVLSAERLLAETIYPQLPLLNNQLVVIPITLITTVTTLFTLGFAFKSSQQRKWLRESNEHPTISTPAFTPSSLHLVTLSPLLLNLLHLPFGNADLVRSGLLLWASLWLVIVLFVRNFLRPQSWKLWLPLLWLLLLPIFWATLGRDVGTADTFEFQVTAPQMGIAHPTGYPLYLLLGKIWTLLPTASSVAMRLNIGTMCYALFALGLMWSLLTHLFNLPAISALTVFVFGLLPTYWSQIVGAEIYTLHSAFVVGTLLVCHEVLRLEQPEQHSNRAYESLLPLGRNLYLLLFFLLGFGLTNHLTTLLLLPAATFAILLTRAKKPWQHGPRFLTSCLFIFLSPLLLYAYLPIRWQAVNGESMGFGRFLQWVTGSRFAGALQLTAWLSDRTRWGIVGRFFLQEWGWLGIVAVLIGFICLLAHNWRFALILFTTWAAFSFYCLNYYVPDLNVFLLPAHLCMTIAWGAGPAFLATRLMPKTTTFEGHGSGKISQNSPSCTAHLVPILLIITTAIIINRAATTFAQVDASAPNPLVRWGNAALSESIAQGAAVLADSDKFPPLFYLQQAEGLRSDLEIMVLPDEAAYRNEATVRLENGQSVYLARFLPRLPYAMRAVGPLVELLPERAIEPLVEDVMVDFGRIHLIDAAINPNSAYKADAVTIKMLWQSAESASVAQQVYFRWEALEPTSFPTVNGYYPTVAWQVGELIDDFYIVDWPASNQLIVPSPEAQLSVAMAPAFTPAEQLIWHELGAVNIEQREVRLQPDCVWLVRLLPCTWPTVTNPIVIPTSASNLENKVALVSIDTPNSELVPGAIYKFTLNWISLSEMHEDYTVFTQILDENDTIVGQVDSWPVQGTFPTSQWEPGQTIRDPYAIQLDPTLESGSYRLVVGMYLLGDLRRLPILDANGNPIDDKISVPNLFVP